MFIATLVRQYAALRLRLPPAVALLVGGGALAFVPAGRKSASIPDAS